MLQSEPIVHGYGAILDMQVREVRGSGRPRVIASLAVTHAQSSTWVLAILTAEEAAQLRVGQPITYSGKWRDNRHPWFVEARTLAPYTKSERKHFIQAHTITAKATTTQHPVAVQPTGRARLLRNLGALAHEFQVELVALCIVLAGSFLGVALPHSPSIGGVLTSGLCGIVVFSCLAGASLLIFWMLRALVRSIARSIQRARGVWQ